MMQARTLGLPLAALLVLCLLPSVAAARPRAALLDPAKLGRSPVKIRDSVVRGEVRATAASYGGYITAFNGERVRVLLSDRYAPNNSVLQSWADFLARLPHGSELGSVTVYVAPLEEMTSICSAEANACYDSDQQVMVVVGDVPPDGTPIEELAAHEYGHHIANNRNNAPWAAFAYGPKNWASYNNVCANTEAGSFFPGDERAGYRFNPGEGWAESYRVFSGGDPSVWGIVDETFRPDADARNYIWQDIYRPWGSYTTQTRRGSFAARARTRGRTYKFSTFRDGRARIYLTGSPGLDVDLFVYDGDGRVLGRSRGRSSREKLSPTICGEASIRVQVYHYGGSGRYTLALRKP